MMKKILIILVLLAVNAVDAAPIYKSVDHDGNVSYSETPPDRAAKIETVTPPPPPSEQDVARAKQRYRDLEIRDAQRERERQNLANQKAMQEQQRAYADMKRQLSKQKSSNVIVINQNPTYRRVYPWRKGRPWKKRRLRKKGPPRPTPLPKDQNGMTLPPPSLKPR